MKTVHIIGILLLTVIFIVGAFAIKNKKITTPRKPVLIKLTPFVPTPTPAPLPTLTQNQLSTKHQPVTLEKGDILVSFRIDDINFSKEQKPIIEKAIYLARKYNITFDLAVIAKQFDEKKDPAVFKLYQDNQDILEVVSHGYDHVHYLNDPDNGEFGGADVAYQEEHFQKMLAIFNKYHLTMATKILFVPWHFGDQNTINLAKKYSYQFLTQLFVPNSQFQFQGQNLIVSDSISVFGFSDFKKFLNQNQIEVIIHPPDLSQKIINIENFCKIVTNISASNKLKFDFVSRYIKTYEK